MNKRKEEKNFESVNRSYFDPMLAYYFSDYPSIENEDESRSNQTSLLFENSFFLLKNIDPYNQTATPFQVFN